MSSSPSTAATRRTMMFSEPDPAASGELKATTSPEKIVRSDARGMQRMSSRSTAESPDPDAFALLFSVGAMAAPERGTECTESPTVFHEVRLTKSSAYTAFEEEAGAGSL